MSPHGPSPRDVWCATVAALAAFGFLTLSALFAADDRTAGRAVTVAVATATDVFQEGVFGR